MSRLADLDPTCAATPSPAIDLVIAARPRDLGGFSVRRVLPSPMRRLVGPFVFFDHMGPVDFAPGHGIDVRPHPHIGLATITYLFDGEILHRDSLGNAQPIRPGDVNWMVAGHGIVHSERTAPDVRARGGRMHGLQTWVALPLAHEETAPRFEHHAAETIPVVRRPGVELRVVAGTAFGAAAPTGVLSPTLYVHARIDAGAELPLDDADVGPFEERAVYVVDGEIACDGRIFRAGEMFVLRPRARAVLRAVPAVPAVAAVPAASPDAASANVMIVGGAPLDGPRHVWWNFVASSEARISRAKDDWRAGRFPRVPGDDVEFIPLPEA